MTHKTLFAALIAGLASSASAAERIQPAMMTAEDLAPYLPEGENASIETRLDADFTGDGLRDLAYVVRGDETRSLRVLVAYANEFDMGYDPVGEMAMDTSPLGNASLSAKNDALVVEDLAGGTSAAQSLYRFRYDPKAMRMRLIGDDVTYYSRTNQHGSISISTNRLTGVRITTESELEGETYVDRPAKRSQVAKKPIYMEDAPSPAETLGLDD